MSIHAPVAPCGIGAHADPIVRATIDAARRHAHAVGHTRFVAVVLDLDGAYTLTWPVDIDGPLPALLTDPTAEVELHTA